MLVSLLHRMILWELVKVFFLSLVAITGILLMAGIVAEASQQGLSPMQVLEVIPLLIPSTLPYTLPATTLFATCVVYGRLAADNEILAIKAAGVNIMKVVWPGIFLGLVMSCVTMGLYYRIIPYTHLLMRTLFLNDVKEVMYSLLKKEKHIDNPRLDFAIYVRDVQGRKLIDTTFQHRSEPPHTSLHDFVIWAKEAELEVDQKNRKLIVKLRYGELSKIDGATAKFETRDEMVDLPPIGESGHNPRPRDQSWKQLREARAAWMAQLDEQSQNEGVATKQLNAAATPEHVEKHKKELTDAQQARQSILNNVHQIDTEFQMRPALALGCLCFVLIGCPVGIWFSRSDYLSAFITCFLPIVFVYYPLTLCGTNFAKEGKLPPMATVWAADGVAAIVGVILFSRLLKN